MMLAVWASARQGRAGAIAPGIHQPKALLAIVALFAASIWSGQVQAQTSKADLPPPLERLLDPVKQPAAPEERPLAVELSCRKDGASCADPYGPDGARRLYGRLRRWWRPPDNTRITTAVWFGASARAAALNRSEKDTISLLLKLAPSGGLQGPPLTIVADQIGFAPAVVADLRRAVERGQPYDMFPSAKYEQWKDVLLRIRIDRR
jgi:hypothetical protein